MTPRIFVLFCTLSCCACQMAASQRCDEGMIYKHGTCQRVAGKSTDAAEDGLGVPCFSDSECADFEADYCVRDPASEDPGYCSYKDCDKMDDTCPEGYRCCEFPESIAVPHMCVTLEDYPMAGMCQDGGDGPGEGTDSDLGGEIPTGLGNECAELGYEACDGNEADFCVKNPADPNPGYCGPSDCTPQGIDCPSGWQCCKMAMELTLPDGSPMPTYCTKDEDFDANPMCEK